MGFALRYRRLIVLLLAERLVLGPFFVRGPMAYRDILLSFELNPRPPPGPLCLDRPNDLLSSALSLCSVKSVSSPNSSESF